MPSISDLLSQAEASLDRFEFEESLKLCEAAIKQDAVNVDALQLYASVLIELGQVEPAREVLLKAIAACPNSGFEKYLAVAQLSTSTEALGYYSEAARLIKENIGAMQEGEDFKHLKRQHSSIFCSAAELYLTDLCFDDNAEQQCSALVLEAISADPTNPESFRIQADLRLSQEKTEDAKIAINHCIALWKDLSFDDLQYPLYEQRIAMAKVLLEVEMFDEATTILEALLEEDDSVIDTWYLLGIAQVSLQDTEGAIEALVSAMALLVRMPADEVDEEQKESIFKFLHDIGVDGRKIWVDLEAEYKSMQGN